MISGNPTILADLARVHRLPAINQFPDFSEKGGLLAYGPDEQEMFRQAGTMAQKVLLGLPVAQLPIDRPARFKLTLNQKTANTLGLNRPPTLLARADDVIE
jgi:putative ABC transport system substrate-binding protein